MRERWWQAPEAARLPAAWLERSVAGWMQAAAAGETLSTDRDAAAARVEAPDGPLLVKWRRPRASKAWKGAWRPSRERGEARGLLLARSLAIAVPAPLLVGERRGLCGRLLGAVLVRPWIADRENAHALLSAPGGERLLAPLSRAVRAWHDAGYRHGDAWPKNLLLSRDGRDALPIGAAKAARARAGAGVDRARLRDLARLAAGARLLWPERDPLEFLAAYAEAPGLSSPEALRRAVEPLLLRVLARRAMDERTRPRREPHGPPPPVALPPDRAPVRRVVVALAALSPPA